MPFKEPSSEGQIVVYSWLYDSIIQTTRLLTVSDTIDHIIGRWITDYSVE